MAQTGVTIRRTANTTIVDDYLKKALEENPTAWGIAIVLPDGVMTNSGDDADLGLIQETMKEYPERDFVLYLCNCESAINMDDVSPFWAVERNETIDGEVVTIPKVVCFITGEWSGYTKQDSTHPSAYHYFEDYLKEKIEDLWDLCDADVEKVFSQLEKPLNKKEIMKDAIAPASVTIVGYNGKTLTLNVGDKAAEYKWGWVSNNYGYATAPQPQPQPQANRKGMGRSTVREKAPAAQETLSPSPTVTKAPETAGAAVVGKFSTRKERPPESLNRKDRKAWYNRRIGYYPEGHEDRVAIEVVIETETNQLVPYAELRKLGLEAVSLPRLNNPPKVGGARDDKNTTPEHVKGSEKPTGPAETKEHLPIIPPISRKFVGDMLAKEDVKKLLAENGEVVKDPTRIGEEERRIVGFSEQVGLKNAMFDCATLCFLDFEAQKKWNKENPDTYDVFVRGLINYYLATKIAKESKLTAAEVHTAAKEELKPTRNMMPQRRRA